MIKEKIKLFNENYFNIIDSSIKAYSLGFIVADGCLYKNTLIFNNAISDESSIYKILENMKFKGNIRTGRPCKNCDNKQDMIRAVLTSSVLINDLHLLGVPSNKSKCVFGIPNIPSEYINDFVSGYFDGDGCISIWKNRNFELSFTDSNNLILEEIQKYLLNYNITSQLRFRKTYYQLRSSGKFNALRFYNNIYNKSLGLPRKLNKFLDIIPC